jgi:cytosine/adenosine deaminase-related metal-dependent hydrolase
MTMDLPNKPMGESPMQYLTRHLDPNQRSLFVHNTLATRADIQVANNWSDRTFWVSCPNANLYIENRLPNYQLFLEEQATVCLGTDSLCSNWQLSIFEEMRTIAKFQSYIDTATLIKWSSLHGALALGMEDQLGSIEVGKQPGLNLVTLDAERKINSDSTSTRII